MVAVVSGSGLGLFGSSISMLGGVAGSSVLGRGTDRVYVNTATGNLIVQSRDESLSALGLDLALVRTYNSQGLLNDDNGDNWRLGVHQRLYQWTSPLNTAGSAVTKVFGDGREVLYTYDVSQSRYVSSEGDGAHDTLSYNSGSAQWTWTDGSSRNTETYNNLGELIQSRDTDGNTATYGYTNSLLTQITDASGQTTYLDYVGGNLAAIRVVSNGQTQTLTRYTYDGSNRLIQVRVDLSPQDNSIADNQVYTTTYGYDGASRRIASITQSDGSSVSFTYEEIGGEYRVRTYTDTENRVTTLTYSQLSGQGISLPANGGVLSTTDTQSYSLNSGALSGTSAWAAAALLESSGTAASDARIAFDANGNGFAVWAQGNDLIVRRYTASTNTWAAVVVLDGLGTAVFTPALAVDGAGNAVVAWVQSDGTANSVYARHFDVTSGAWSTAEALESAADAVSTTAGSLAVSVNGALAAVAWVQTASGQENLYASVYDVGSWWGPDLVDSGSSAVNRSAIAIDASINATVLWRQSDGTAESIYASRYSNTTFTWGAPTLLEGSATGAGDPRLVFDANGNGLAVWNQGNDLIARRYTSSTDTWSSPVTLDGNSNAVSAPALSIDAATGNAIAAWVQSDGTAESVYVSRYTASTNTWSAAVLLESSSQAVVNTTGSLSTSIRGSYAAVAWVQSNGTADSVYAARWSGSAWSAAELLENSSNAASQPSVAIDAQGYATVVWQQSDGTASSIYQSRYVGGGGGGQYYIVPSGATWQSIANTLYGVNSAAAGSALQTALGNPPLTTGAQLSGFPGTLNVTVTVPAYYTVQAGNTWASITQTIYGTSDAAAVAALQAALGNPTLTTGLRLTVPLTLNFTPTPQSLPANGGVLSTTDTQSYSLNTGALSGTSAWAAAALLESSGTAASDARLAFDANGNGFAVWAQGNDLIVRRYTASTNTWAAAVVLDGLGTAVSSPALAVDGAGNAVVAWVQSDGTANSVYARHFDVTSGVWSTAEALESAAGAVSTTAGSLAVSVNGALAAVAWVQTASGQENLYASVYDVGSWWGPDLVDTGSSTVNRSAIAIDASINATVLWRQSDGTAESIYASRYSNTTFTWGTPTLLEGSATGAGDPRLVFDANGNGLAVWNQGNDLIARRYTSSTDTWSSPVTLDGNSNAVSAPALSIDAATGNAIAAWVQSDGTAESVYVSRYTASTNTWSTAVLLESVSQAVVNTTGSLTTSIRGSYAAVAWLQSDGAADSVYAARWNGSAWSAAELLESSNNAASQPSVAIDAQGYATVVWQQSDGTASSIYQSRYVGGGGGGQYYTVPSGATWQSIANTLYGVNSAAAGSALQTALGNPALTTGAQLTGFPATLNVTVTVPAYYTVQAGNTWASITQTIYGTSDTAAIAALQAALGNPTLTTGLRLTVPLTLSFTPGGGGGTPGVYLNTDVQDALGRVTTYIRDGAGRLISVLSPTVNGVRLETRYAYDSAGNVISITDDPTGLNRVTSFSYDANGNWLTRRDSLGNTVTRTYNAENQLLSETLYLVPDPDGAGSGQPSLPLTTRYVYDSESHLRFVISAQGRVTEHRYTTAGLLEGTRTYTGALYTSANTALSDLTTWAGSQDLTRLERADYTYDFRGNLSARTAFATTNASGDGTGTPSITRFVYDQRGLLLQMIEDRGSASMPNPATPNLPYATTYTYDGLARVRTTTQWHSSTSPTTTVDFYDDANRRTTTTLANGLVTTRTYNGDGELISLANGTASTPSSLGTTTYAYDASGRLRIVTDPAGVRQFYLYDGADRRSAHVDGDGTLTEFIYDRASQLIKTVKYAALIGGGTLASLVDGQGNPTAVTLDTLRTAASDNAGQDRITRNVYDNAGRLVYTLDELGAVTQFFYDGAGHVTDEVRYANRVTIARTVDQVLPGDITPTPSTNDRRTRHFYDADGKLLGTLDGEGYLVEYRHDPAGYLFQQIAYANRTNAAYWSAGTLEQLRTSAGTDEETTVDPERDIVSYFFYDGQGRRIGVLDAEQHLTETVYDVTGNVSQTIRYNIALTSSAGSTFQSLRSAAAAAPTHTKSYQYDEAGRRTQETDQYGTITTYAYDAIGNLTSTTRAATTAEARTTQVRYDLLGRVLQELTAEGSALLAGGAPVEDTWNRYGITYAYDLAGRRISATLRPNDAQTNVTRYYYDNDNRLRFEINQLGERKEYRYNALGQVTDEIAYTNRISTTGLNGGLLTSALITTLTASANPAQDAHTIYQYSLTGKVESLRVLNTANSADDSLTTYTYNAFGENNFRTEWIDTTRTLPHEYRYDRRGQLIETIWGSAPLTTSETRQYDAFGRLTQLRDARLNTSRIEYDRLGRQIATVDALNNRRITTYDAFSRVLTTRDATAAGNETRYTYNDATRSVDVRTPEGIVVRTAYNLHGETSTVTVLASGQFTTYTYDRNGRLTAISDNLGALEGRAYDRAGRQVSETDARDAITSFSYDAANRIFTRTVDSATGGLQLVTTYTYDGQGRVTRVQEPNGRITDTTYDAAGRVTEVAVDPNSLNLRTAYAYDRMGHVVTVTEGAGSALGAGPRRTQYLFDTLGRRIEEIVDPTSLGGTLNLRTTYEYDANGNVIRKVEGAGTAQARTTRYVYDADNQLRYTVDALSGVTASTYDGEGRLTSVRRLATTVDLSGLPVDMTVAQIEARRTLSAQDRLEVYVYDRDGRNVVTVDALGGVTHKTFDANGNVLSEVHYDDTVPTGTYYTTAQSVLDNITADATRDRSRSATYDLRGRVMSGTDALNTVTQLTHDANGNLTSTTVNPTSLQSRTTRHWYDATNRLRFTLDAEGYLTEIRYNDAGRQETSIVYAAKPTILSGATLAQVVVAAGQIANAANDQSTTTLLDAAGRVARVTDTLTNYEEYTYDAVGNKLTYRNKRGSVWTYVYDANRRLLDERSPEVAITTVVDGGADLTSSEVTANIVTRMTYDVFGNVLTRTEGIRRFTNNTESTIGSRVTSYTFDALNRQTRTTFPTVGVYSNTGDTQLGNGAEITRTESNLALYSEVAYDALGNAFRNRDVAGSYSFKIYDALGRVEYEIDAERYVTRFQYDTFGNVTALTRHARALTAELPNSTTSLTSAALNGLLVPVPAEDRVLLKTYDRLNRLVQVTEPTVWNFLPNAGTSGGSSFTAAATTLNEYDAFGDLVRTRRLLDSNTNSYAETYFYYDRRGLKRAQVDPLRYLTVYEYDETSDLTRQIEYARALTGAVTTSSYGTPLVTTQATLPDSAGGYDREVVYAYDRLNRKVSETRVGIEHATVSQAGVVDDDELGNQVTTFGYDVLGNQTRQTQVGVLVNGTATDLHTYTYYDVLGRVIAIAEPIRNRGDGTNLTPLTLMRRDAHGNLVEETRYADGTASIPGDGSVPVGGASSLNRLTRWLLDSHGRTIRTEDPIGPDRFVSYNERGQVAKEWQPVVNNDAVTEYLTTLYQYDRLGRQRRVIEPRRYAGPTTFVVTRTSQYNAFGEVIEKGIADGSALSERQEYFHYDQAGRLWRTNSGDGINKVYLHDLTGNVTAEMRSQGRNLADNNTYANAQAVDGLTSDVMRTETRYDALGRVHEQRLPVFATSSGIDPIDATFTIGDVAGPQNPAAIYQRINDPEFGFVYVINPNATLAQDGGYFLNSQGQYIQDASHQLVNAVRIAWAGPTDASVEAKFEYRVLGSTDPDAWAEIPVGVLADNRLGVNVGSLMNQLYEYRASYRRRTETSPYAEATGTFLVEGSGSSSATISQNPVDPASEVSALSMTQANGMLVWAAPADQSVSATFRFRPAGSPPTTSFVNINATRNGGNFQVDARTQLAQAGNYEFEVVYTRTVNGSPVTIARRVGQLNSNGASQPRTITASPSPITNLTFIPPTDAVATPIAQLGGSIGATIVSTQLSNPGPRPAPAPGSERPERWTGLNVVNLQWASLGSGTVRVEIDYLSQSWTRWYWNAADGGNWDPGFYDAVTVTRSFAGTATGATDSWGTADGAGGGGIQRINAVRVYVNEVLTLVQANPTNVYGRGLTWAPPVDENVQPRFEYAVRGTGNFVELPILRGTNGLGVNLNGVPANQYDYRITYRIGGRLTAQQTGQLNITNASQSTIWSIDVTVDPLGAPTAVGSVSATTPGPAASVLSFTGAEQDRAEPEPGTGEFVYYWLQPNNTVNVSYTNIGSRPVAVYVDYITDSWPGHWRAPGPALVTTSPLLYSSLPTGGPITWQESGTSNFRGMRGGISSVQRVRVYGQDGQGAYTVLLRDTAGQAGGGTLRWSAPPPGTAPYFEYFNGSTWVPRSAGVVGSEVNVDVSGLSGTYQYRIRHFRNGESFASSFAEGSFTVSGGNASIVSQTNTTTSWLGGVTEQGMAIAWTQAPVSDATVRFEYFLNGSWVPAGPTVNGGNYSFSFAGFQQGSYAYRISYIRNQSADPYLYASGTAIVTASTTTIPASLTITPGSNLTFPPATINVQLVGDALTWSHPRQGENPRVQISYRYNGVTQGPILLTNSGPAFSFSLSELVAPGNHQVWYDIDYFAGNETNSYARASGYAIFNVSYPTVHPTLTINSQMAAYPSGVQAIGAPSVAGTDIIAWGPLAEAGADVVFRYQYAAGGDWTELAEEPSGNGYLVDLASVAGGITFNYEILYTRATQTNPYARGTGTMRVTRNSTVTDVEINPVPPGSPQTVLGTPRQLQSIDRWGNAISVTDTAGNTTDYRYNQYNQLMEVRQPLVAVTSTTGGQVVQETRRPVTFNYYDRAGRLIATRDGNGNLERATLNAAGQIIGEIHADGGDVRNTYDAFGAIVATEHEVTNGVFYETRNTFDRAGRLTAVARELIVDGFATPDPNDVITETYGYDAAGRRISETNGENETTRYYYDLQDNLIARRSALNAYTFYDYDAQGRKTSELDAIGGSMAWGYDYFGRMMSHTDLAGVNFTYSYGTNSGLLESQVSSGGQNISYTYDAAGHLAQINDAGVSRITNYSYDSAGRRAREKTRINGLTYQDTMIEYDELNRIRELSDLRYGLAYSYDAQGNRTRIQGTYYDHAWRLQTQDLWYTYDSMNRVLISQGANTFNQIEVNTTQGVELTYDLHGRRISSRTYGPQKIREETRSEWNGSDQVDTNEWMLVNGYVNERYEYDGLDRLDRTYRGSEHYLFVRLAPPQGIVQNSTTQGEVLISDRTYDRASREIFEETAQVEDQALASRRRTSVYDDDGRLDTQDTMKLVGLNWRTESAVRYDYDAAGVLRTYEVDVHSTLINPQREYTSYYTNFHRLGDSYQDGGQSVFSTPAYSGAQVPQTGSVTRNYNVNGELTSFIDNNDATKNRYFANGANGEVLMTIRGNVSNVPQAFANALARADNNAKSQYFFFANGEAVGSFGQLRDGSGAFTANFDVNYTPISQEYPSSVPASLVAQAGDTLRSIAGRVFGDGNLWYVLAEENGLTNPDAEIEQGTVIRVPNEVISLDNRAGAFKPFEVAEAIGDTSPTQPAPPVPKKNKGCGGFGQLLMIVVAVAVSFFLTPIVASALAPTLGTTAAGIAGAAVGAAAGSVASQGVGIAVGAQQEFSWKAVAAAALSAGITQGVPINNVVVGAAVNSAVNQGVHIALGLQESFSWEAVAASAVAAPIAQAAGESVGNAVGRSFGSEFAGNVAGQLTTGLVNQAAYAAFTGGKINYAQLAGDAFGNVLGQSIADNLLVTPHERRMGSEDRHRNRLYGTESSFAPSEPMIDAPLDNNPDFFANLPIPTASYETDVFGGRNPFAGARLVDSYGDAVRNFDRRLLASINAPARAHQSGPYLEFAPEVYERGAAAVARGHSAAAGLNDWSLERRMPESNIARDVPFLLSTPVGLAETAMAVGTGLLGTAANGWASILTGDTGFGQALQDRMTYMPRTQIGEATTFGVGLLMSPVASALEYTRTGLGDAAYSITGSPAIAASLYSAPDALLTLLAPEVRGAFASVGGAAASSAKDLALMAGRTFYEAGEVYMARTGAQLNIVPGRWTPPINWQGPAPIKGSWSGDIGNSTFTISDDLASAAGVPAGTKIRFVEGVPDFGPFAVKTPAGTAGSFEVRGLVYEHAADARTTVQHLAAQSGSTPAQVRQWLAQQNVRMHHFHGSTMQLVPEPLHTRIHHTGSRALNGQ